MAGYGRERGDERFGALVEAFAATSAVPLEPVVTRLRRPLRVGVHGRRGVGRSTVAAALEARGVRVVATAPEVRVLVLAETFKPEDERLLAEESLPTVVVLTKADVMGSGPKGPLWAADRRAAGIAAVTGRPVRVLVGLLATVTTLEPDLVAALRAMVTEPADLSSVDAFVATPHRIPPEVRERLLAVLDRFGVAHAVLALAEGVEPAGVVARLHELSNVAAVLADVAAATAPARYRRVAAAMGELRCLAVQYDDERLIDLLASDGVVDAIMAVAVEVAEAAGLDVESAAHPDGFERRALRWTHHAREAEDGLLRSCAADIVRGSLRRSGVHR